MRPAPDFLRRARDLADAARALAADRMGEGGLVLASAAARLALECDRFALVASATPPAQPALEADVAGPHPYDRQEADR